MKKVYRGPRWRVQVQTLVFDDHTTYIARALPTSANKYAAYTTGEFIYCGRVESELMGLITPYLMEGS